MGKQCGRSGFFGLFGKKEVKVEPKPITKDEQRKLDELNKGLAETVKKKQENQPKPIIEKIPDDIMKLIRDLGEKKNGLLNQFLNISTKVVDLEPKLTKIKKVQKETMEHIKEVDKSIDQKFKHAYDELKLNKRTDYKWGFNGQDAFVGNIKPRPKEQPKK